MKLFCQNHNNLIQGLLPNSSTPQCFSTHGLDEFTLLHLLSGTASNVFFPNQKFIKLFAIHVLWEYLETREDFRKFFFKTDLLNGSTMEYHGDSLLNFITDNLAFYVGYELQKKLNLDKKEIAVVYLLSFYLTGKLSLYRFG